MLLSLTWKGDFQTYAILLICSQVTMQQQPSLSPSLNLYHLLFFPLRKNGHWMRKSILERLM